MDRRDFLTATKSKPKKIVAPVVSPARTLSGINPYNGVWTTNEVIHLLKRTMFGAKKADVDYFLTKTVGQAVDELMNPTAPNPTPPIKEYVTSTQPGTPDGNIPQGTTWVNDINGDGTVQSQRRASYKKWWAGVMLNQDRSIREKMQLFWVDHFGNEASDVGIANWVYKQHNTIRQNVLGNFKQMVKAITIDVSMLRYLNGYLNTATAPDENYGRELQELFTLGKGVDSKYTESDVKEAAKVLTGWQVNGTTYQSFFNINRHSTANKQFSSFYNNTVVTGRTGATAGDLEINDLLNMIFAQNEVAKFLVRKFYRWFVYYEIDAATEANVITPLADIFRSSNYDIKPVLTTLFKSEHFFDVANQGCVIKTPVDIVIGAMREYEVKMPLQTDWDTSYGHWNTLYSWMVNMGLNLHDPPNVSGIPAYYQEPSFHELWVTTDTLPKRNQFTDVMTNTGYSRNGFRMQFDFTAVAKTFSNPGNPNDLLEDALKYFYRIQVSPQTKAQMKTQMLLSNQLYDYYWTNAWSAYIANPTTANFNIVNTRLKDLFRYLMNLSEYQLS
ncbi:MAG: DUF1800 domain-containing protein [Ferruginibacter sp.]|nr:DUF1800 domain-containing protein [Ferruginibacter sp.]